MGRRVSLVDADGAIIVGAPKNPGTARSVPIIVNDATVGYMRIAPQQKLTEQLDRDFTQQQERAT